MRSYRDEVEDLRNAIRLFGSESSEFRRRLDRLLAEYEALRRRYQLTREQFTDAERQNERLVNVLQEAKQQIEMLKEEVDKLCAPPNNYGIFSSANKDGTAEILVDGRPMRVNVHPNVDPFQFVEGQHVVLNEAFNIVESSGFVSRGEIASIVDFIADNRAIVLGHTDDERVVTLAEPLRSERLKVGDNLLYDPRTHYAFEKLPKSAVEEVVLEEIPNVTYDDIGGLGDQIEMLRDSVELPYIYPEVFAEHQLSPPKGILLYGPPGCGKTLIAKAVANSLAKSIEQRTGRETTPYFLNVKGPELLNKYVGETEHKLREVFKKARDKASEDVPVVIFFDEMDSLFRMRGSGISSDMEATVVAQFLSEIDGVESLKNVIVIGASNRQDLIDPAVLRPGRLDLKIKVNRPDAQAAREIFTKYLLSDLPFHLKSQERYGSDPAKIVEGMIVDTIEHMYRTSEENKFLEVTYAKGEREIFYFKDFASGAMIQNIVSRAKKRAVKRMIENDERGIQLEDLVESVNEEFKENEDLPNTTNPDDWARISGRKGERIINVRTLMSGISRKERSIENITSGQYL
ncbi:MAG: proteasome ATPase [Myxococcales bacterium]|nr:proteasome ATPase [Myxococcales bacterium]MDH5306424.1 proteasome ATPase [Myxococcales bacterium]MDH5565933.1 proteasome ATPase [Myxococcales bacterium]